MQCALQVVKYKLQSQLFDYLDVKSSKDHDFTKTLKSKICAFYIWLQVIVLDYHGNYMINNMLIMKGVFTKMAS